MTLLINIVQAFGRETIILVLIIYYRIWIEGRFKKQEKMLQQADILMSITEKGTKRLASDINYLEKEREKIAKAIGAMDETRLDEKVKIFINQLVNITTNIYESLMGTIKIQEDTIAKQEKIIDRYKAHTDNVMRASQKQFDWLRNALNGKLMFLRKDANKENTDNIN